MELLNHLKNSTIMTTILNQSQHTTSPSTQQAIQHACANMGYPGDVSLVCTNQNFEQQDEAPVYSVRDWEGIHLFTINTENDQISE